MPRLIVIFSVSPTRVLGSVSLFSTICLPSIWNLCGWYLSTISHLANDLPGRRAVVRVSLRATRQGHLSRAEALAARFVVPGSTGDCSKEIGRASGREREKISG